MRTTEQLLRHLVQAVSTAPRGGQLALFADDAAWRFPLARAGEPDRPEGRNEIGRVVALRRDGAHMPVPALHQGVLVEIDAVAWVGCRV
ncbi:MAG: hypothetical protein M3R41_00760 [Pseudomonadota bacterium]|nr:hypothetical protein [Pseudomonadota bacterium]